jgi:hypothetical protein
MKNRSYKNYALCMMSIISGAVSTLHNSDYTIIQYVQNSLNWTDKQTYKNVGSKFIFENFWNVRPSENSLD